MTKESGGDIVLGPETDPNDKDSSQLSEMPDTENIQIQPNTKQLQNSKNARGAGKRPQFVRRVGIRKRSYSYSEGHSSGKRFKRGPKSALTSGTKFLFGGNIRDPLNLNALSHDEIERRKSDSILQPKKFEGHSAKTALMAVTGKRWKKNPTNYEKNKFLLGGNFRDPLNLNSLSDEKIARIANAVTPQSSPMPTPMHRKAEYKIEVLIPPNISDPLNLMSFEDDSSPASSELLSPEAMRRRRHQQVQQQQQFAGKGGGPQAGLNTGKFENSEQQNCSNKKVRFRKRAKSMVSGGLSTSSDHDAGFMSVAAKVALANKRKREVDESSTMPDEASGKGKLESDREEGEKKPEEETDKVGNVSEQLEKDDNIQHTATASASPIPSTSQTLKKSVTISLPQPEPSIEVKKSGKTKKFEYGNYNRYYGYRNPGACVFPGTVEDSRLFYFRPEWFFGKDILDIGCNVGSLTLEIGRRFAPKSLLGIDIDPELIRMAKKFAENLRDYQVPISSQPTPIASLSAAATPSRSQDSGAMPSTSTATEVCEKKETKNCESVFPQCFPLLYGPLDPTGIVSGLSGGGGGGLSDRSTSAAATPHPQQTPRATLNSGGPMSLFGRKVRFICDNYVLETDDLLELAQPEFDTILCLSTTKWIHLNFGDDGIKRAFKRMYAQLRPGGILVLEAQSYSSYSKKKKLTPRIFENFQSIQFLPEHFSEYLLHEVGFTTSHVIAVPRHASKGFQRPIQVFTKMPLLSSRSVGETSSSQNTPYYCASCGGGCTSSCPATPYSSHTTPYHSCSGSCQATPHYYHHYNNLGSEGETPVHSSMQ